ncbi:hypothetical protein D3C73_1173500 [compost metagenome]
MLAEIQNQIGGRVAFFTSKEVKAPEQHKQRQQQILHRHIVFHKIRLARPSETKDSQQHPGSQSRHEVYPVAAPVGKDSCNKRKHPREIRKPDRFCEQYRLKREVRQTVADERMYRKH